MDRPMPGYRDAAMPPRERFALRMGATARAGLAFSAIALAITLLAWIVTGHLFLVFFAAFGPALYYLLSGAPRTIEVGHDELVIRSWLRPPRHLAKRELTIHSSDREIVLATPEHTVAIATEHFGDGELERFLATARAATDGG